jgi:guanylate kinase
MNKWKTIYVEPEVLAALQKLMKKNKDKTPGKALRRLLHDAGIFTGKAKD